MDGASVPKNSNRAPIQWTKDHIQSELRSLAGRERLSCTTSDNAFLIADILDSAIAASEILDPGLLSEYIALLRKLCGKFAILPASHVISQGSLEYRPEDYVGLGGFADVYRGSYEGQLVAVKVFKPCSPSQLVNIRKIFYQEAVVWRCLSHHNIVSFVGASFSPSNPLTLVSVWMENGDIMKYTKVNPGVNRLRLLRDVATGVEYLHRHNLVHGDLKGANILITAEDCAALADFGLVAVVAETFASYLHTTTTSERGTPRWMAPELLIPENFGLLLANPTRSSDLYALGMVIFEVLTGNAPFNGLNANGVILNVMNGTRPNRPQLSRELGLSDEIWDIVQLCWREKAFERPKVEEVLAAIRKALSGWNSKDAASAFIGLGVNDRPALDCKAENDFSERQLNVDHTGIPPSSINGLLAASVLSRNSARMESPTSSEIEVRGRPPAANQKKRKGEFELQGRSVSDIPRSCVRNVSEASDTVSPLQKRLSGLIELLKPLPEHTGGGNKLPRIILQSLRIMTITETEAKIKTDMGISDELQRTLGETMHEIQQWIYDKATPGVLNQQNKVQVSRILDDLSEALEEFQVKLQQDLSRKRCGFIGEETARLLSQLPRARDAGFMSETHTRCLKGTRIEVLEQIGAWVEDPEDRRVYWLNGLAGTGKSTISQSVARRLFGEGQLGASFFCSRDFSDRSNIHLIFPTIAFDLAYQYPEFRAALIDVLASTPNIGHQSIAVQLEKLLIEPLKTSGISTVIVIDALDECKDDEAVSVILSLLARHIGSIPRVRFFITGRPELQIRLGFHHRRLGMYTNKFILHEIDRATVDEDMHLYLKTRLLDVVQDSADIEFVTPWPNDSDIEILVRKCEGFFIFASTASKFISSPHGDPQELLQAIVNIPESTTHEGRSGVDALYTRILEDNHALVPQNLGIAERTRAVLATIVLAYNPLSRTAMALLLGVRVGEISASLHSLHSLLFIPENETSPIHVFHKSFPDYITDAQRCKILNFYVEPRVHHSQLAIRCLQLMNTGLKRNLCSLPRYKMNKDIGDLFERRKTCIGDALEYACQFWARHLCLAYVEGEDTNIVVGFLKKLMQKHLLSWLEVLSICNALRDGASTLHDIQGWLTKLKIPENDLLNSVQDAERFLLRFFDPIQQSALHIYESALPWSPELSLVRQRYLYPGGNCVKLSNAVDSKWDNCILKMEAGGIIVGIAFSNNRALFGCCCYKSLKLFEAATGSLYAEMNPRENEFYSFAFAQDDTIIATGSDDGQVSIWDVKTGGIIKVLKGHTKLVRAVAFLHQGVLASGSYDGTIRIWDTGSGDCTSTLVGEARAICSTSWSPQNQLLAIARVNEDKKMETVEIWDTRTQKIRNANFAQSYLGRIAYCPNGSSLASVDESSIKIREGQTGDITQTHSPSEKVSSNICYSPSGTQIVYGTDCGLFIWDLETDVHQLICKVAKVEYVAFSPDGSSIATASFGDSVIRIWRVDGAGIEQSCSSPYQTSEFNRLYTSWDGRRVVSTSNDGSMKLWDAVAGMCLMSFHDPGQVSLATISNDNGLLASLSWVGDCLQIWSCADGALLMTIIYPMISLGDLCLPTSARFSPNARQIITVTKRNNMVLWDVETGMRIDEVDLSVTRRSYRINGEGDFVPSSEASNTEILSIVSETTSDDEQIQLVVSSSRRPVIDCAPLPESYVPVVDDPFVETSTSLSLIETGWVEDFSGRRIFWVPEDMRQTIKDYEHPSERYGLDKSHSRGRVWEIAPGKLAFMDYSDLL